MLLQNQEKVFFSKRYAAGVSTSTDLTTAHGWDNMTRVSVVLPLGW